MESHRSRRASIIVIAVLGLLLVGALAGVLVQRAVLEVRPGAPVEVAFDRAIPFQARIQEQLDVGMAGPVTAQATLGDSLRVPIDETLDVELDMVLDLPIEGDVEIDQSFDIDVQVPIDMVLTDRELSLERVTVEIDADLAVDDEVAVKTVVPLDTTVSSVLGIQVPVQAKLPLDLKVPIKQTVHVRDTLEVPVKSFRAPLRTTVPVALRVPIKQRIRVEGRVKAPIKKTLAVRIDKVIAATPVDPVPVTVRLDGRLPVSLDTTFRSEAALSQPVQARLGAVRIAAEDVDVAMR